MSGKPGVIPHIHHMYHMYHMDLQHTNLHIATWKQLSVSRQTYLNKCGKLCFHSITIAGKYHV